MFEGIASSFDDFKQIFWGKNVGKESYFDLITHFDFKTLLPAYAAGRRPDEHGARHRVARAVP